MYEINQFNGSFLENLREEIWRIHFNAIQTLTDSPVLRLRSEKWMDVQVGDIIKLENNQFVTVSRLKRNYFWSKFGRNSWIKAQIPWAGDFSGGLLCDFRLTFCCSPAANHSTWCTSRRQSWTGQSRCVTSSLPLPVHPSARGFHVWPWSGFLPDKTSVLVVTVAHKAVTDSTLRDWKVEFESFVLFPLAFLSCSSLFPSSPTSFFFFCLSSTLTQPSLCPSLLERQTWRWNSPWRSPETWATALKNWQTSMVNTFQQSYTHLQNYTHTQTHTFVPFFFNLSSWAKMKKWP